MMFSRNLVILFAVFMGSKAIPWGGSEPTAASDFDGQGISPVPTSGPGIQVIELLKRQSVNTRTCGFIEGSPTSIVTCAIGATCVFDGGAQIIGCCKGAGNCGYATSCVPYSSWTQLCPITASLRTASCPSDIYVDYCSLKNEGFCNTYVWPDQGVTDYECEATSSPIQNVYLTFSGLVSSIRTTGSVVAPISSAVSLTGATSKTTTSTPKATSTTKPTTTSKITSAGVTTTSTRVTQTSAITDFYSTTGTESVVETSASVETGGGVTTTPTSSASLTATTSAVRTGGAERQAVGLEAIVVGVMGYMIALL